MRLRSITIGMTLLVTGTIVGTATQQLVTASTSSGDRPVLIPVTPCRLADTRAAPNTVGPRSAPLAAIDTMTVDAQEPGTDCSGVIPADASAVSLNITALNATAVSYLTVWPGGDRPTAASLNPAPGQPPVPNAVTTALSVDQEFEVYNNAGDVDIVIDVNGYYVDHDHDDRYYTRDQANSEFARQADTYSASEADARFFETPDSIHLSHAAFAPAGNGWAHGTFWIGRVYSITGRHCAVADLTLPAGSTVSRIDVNYWNYALGVTAVLEVDISERRPVADRSTGGETIADAEIDLPDEYNDFSPGLLGVDIADGVAASTGAAHVVTVCTTGRHVYLDSMHISI